MLLKSWSPIRSLAVFTLFACEFSFAANDTELAGLAVYTDTGRDIYVAGLHTPGAQLPADANSIAAPAAMEYRIATRRISSRGLSGTLLLQAELGSGHRAPEGVINALDELKHALEGSFLAGDQFLVRKSPDGSTDFYLNGTELLSLEDSTVFDFLIQGWIGQDSSALMRDSLLSGRLDTEMMVRFEALAPSEERVAAVAGWDIGVEDEIEQAQEQVAAAPEPEPELEPVKESTAEAVVAATVAATVTVAKPESVNTPPVVQETVKAEPAPELEAAEPEPKAPAPEPGNVEEPVQVAAATAAAPQPKLEPITVEVTALDALDDREYKQQLSSYVSQVMNKVLRQVVYPNRAVRRKNEGSVELLAQFDDAGQLLDVSLEASSGYKLLDGAALKAVREAAPFPQVTPVAQEEFSAGDGQSFVMTIPVRFELYD